jgi:hypothetical protein
MAEYEGLLDVADECIRQMEWARTLGRTDNPDRYWEPYPELTAAPDDWNPKETPNEGV